MNPVIHFAIPHSDGARLAPFESMAFGWTTTPPRARTGHCMRAVTAAEDFLPEARGGTLNGGLSRRTPDWPHHYPAIVIGDDVSFLGTEGPRGALFQPDRSE